MSIEELENELKDLKACAYDLNNEYNKLTQRIDSITQEIANIKKQAVEEDKKEVVVEVPDVNQDTPKEEVPFQIDNTEVTEENTVVTPLPVQEEVPNETDDNVVVTPVPVQEEVKVDIPFSQELSQEPLTPSIEIPSVSEKTVDDTYIKADDNQPRAILVTALQGGNLRKSGQVGGLEKTNPQEQLARLNKETEDLVMKLAATTTEEEANKINSQISENTKKAKELEAMCSETSVSEANVSELDSGNVLTKKLEVAA